MRRVGQTQGMIRSKTTQKRTGESNLLVRDCIDVEHWFVFPYSDVDHTSSRADGMECSVQRALIACTVEDDVSAATSCRLADCGGDVGTRNGRIVDDVCAMRGGKPPSLQGRLGYRHPRSPEYAGRIWDEEFLQVEQA